MASFRNASRCTLALAGATAGLVLLAGPASAHYCYFDSPNARADAQRGQARAFDSFRDLLHRFAPCAAAAEQIIADVDGDFPLDVQVHTRATMAGGADRRGLDVRPVAHITAEQFGVLDAAIEEAQAAVEAGTLC